MTLERPARLRVLVVEHDPIDAELTVSALQRAGIELDADVVETREQLAARLAGQSYDIVLADYRLPGWTGMDAFAQLQQQQPGVPFILISGTIGEESAVDYVKRGVADYVIKGNLARLQLAVRHAVANRAAQREHDRADALVHRLSAALDQSPAAVIITDTSGRIEYVNQRFVEVTGYEAGEVIGQNPRILKSGETSLETYRSIWDTITAGRSWRGEIRNRKKNGELFWNAVSIAPLRDQGGGITHFIGTQEDVTERHRVEQQIREREELFRQLADNIREVFYVVTSAFDEVLYVSPAFEEVWGRSSASLYRKPRSFLEAVAPDDLPALLEAMNRAQRGERSGEVDFRVIRPDGSVRWVAGDAVPVRDGSGQVYRIAGIAVDITARKRAEAALAESLVRFQKLTESTFGGISITEGGIVREANRGFAEMFGYGQDEAIGRPYTSFVADESKELVQGRIERREEGTYEFVGRRRNGRKIIVEATDRNHDVDDKPGRITALRDVTEKRQLEDQLRQAQKMEAIGRLAGGIAHDFNNLLTVIRGNTDLLLEILHGGDGVEEANEISNAAAAAATLTRQLLAFSRQQVITPKLIAVEEVLANTGKILRRLMGEDVTLSMNLPPTNALVRIDPGQLEQIVMNLAVNARDAMPTGGAVTIEAGTVELDDSHRDTHWAVEPGRYVKMAVSDTGTGMDEATVERIFEPFFTTKEPGKGTGLGLSTVYGIVKQMGGMIDVRSEPGRGSTFTIYLPTAAPPAAEAAPASAAPPPRRGSETVLVVEDAPAVRAVVRQALQRNGYTVIEAANGSEAIVIVSDLRTPVDLLLTDVVMPGMGGRELVEAVSRIRPNLKVLYMSGYTDDAVVRHGVLDPGVHYIAKPFSSESLMRAVARVLEGTRSA